MLKKVLAASLSLAALAACSKAPTQSPPPSMTQQPAAGTQGPIIVTPEAVKQHPGDKTPGKRSDDCRFIAFVADNGCDKGLFLYDDELKDVYILNAALAGLEGTWSTEELRQLNPEALGEGRILFQHEGKIYVFDMTSEERITVAFDADTSVGAAITSDGTMIAYVNDTGNVVLKLTDGAYYTKTRVLTKIAAEQQFQKDETEGSGRIRDLDLSGDGRWLVLSKDGLLMIYDVENPRLYQILPLDEQSLAGGPGGIGHVAINEDGRYIAFTAGKSYHGGSLRLLVLDRRTGSIDTVPYPNLGSIGDDCDDIADPVFCNDHTLVFETQVNGNWRVWKYDVETERLRALVILNNTLGEKSADNLVSDPYAQ